MFVLRFSWVVLVLVSTSTWAEEQSEEENDMSEMSVYELLERANENRTVSPDEPALIELDIAAAGRNADPCTSASPSCMWSRHTDGMVYVPYNISSQFSPSQKQIIEHGLDSFSNFSCIRFRPYVSGDRDYLYIQSLTGCWSYVGRQGGAQLLSLRRFGCLYLRTIQHEMLHALGFHHEHSRSDRDDHIRVMLENVEEGKERNFDKFATLNQNTGYDYNSVMQYKRDAFSKNDLDTMVPIPDSSVPIGFATEMSQADIIRVNRLYCDPPSSSEGTMSLQFSLDQEFTSDLSDAASSAFQNLAATVKSEINSVYTSSFTSFRRALINHFRNGSVVANMTLVFRNQTSVPRANEIVATLNATLDSIPLNIIPGSIRAHGPPRPTTFSLAAMTLCLLLAVQVLASF